MFRFLITRMHTVDSLKFQDHKYSAPSRALIDIYSNVRQASQIFRLKFPIFSAASTAVCIFAIYVRI